MTEVLFAYHGRAVGLHVLRRTQVADTYTRFIILTAHDSEQVIETGIVRINLGLLRAAVRQEILDAKKPLGSILIEHDVLRQIEPKWYFRLESSCPMLDHFGSGVRRAYGRVGLIHCDHQPTIELLEVVADVQL
jgi:chorismate-pyruvate lyase